MCIIDIFCKSVRKCAWYIYWHKHENGMSLISLHVKIIIFINCICNLWFIYMKLLLCKVLWKFALWATSLDYTEAISQRPMCHKMLRIVQTAHMQDMYFENDKWSCDELLLNRCLYAYLDPFDMCCLSFKIDICDMSRHVKSH